MDVKTFISSIQTTPRMYIEEIKIEYIYYLVNGFLGSNLINGRTYNSDQKFKTYFSGWVLNWITKNLDKNYERKSFFWYHFLRDVTNSEGEAVELFFELCSIFFAQLDELNSL